MPVTSLVVIAGAFLLGSIPFSYLVARRFGVGDVRQVGSGNVGATNVLRTAGKVAGSLAFVLDASKGLVATLLASLAAPGGALPPLAGVAAVLGHMYPPWLRFRGGKGVATGAGAFLPLAPAATVAALAVFALTLALTRYVSLASVAGTLALAALAFLSATPPAVGWSAAACAALVVWKHRANLARIARGTERRTGQGAAS